MKDMLKYSWYEMDMKNHQWNKIEFSVDDKGSVYFPKRDEIKLRELVVLEDTDTANRFRIATDKLTPPAVVEETIAEDSGWIDGPTIVSGTTPDGRFTWVGPGYSARKESQKTILVKAIVGLEEKKTCDYHKGLESKHGCLACYKAGGMTKDCVNIVVQSCISELKSLLGEV